MKALITTLGLLCFSTLLAAPGDDKAEATLRTLSEKTFKGELVSLSEKEFVIKAGDKQETLPASDVIGVEWAAQARGMTPELPYLEVRLIDGSLLKCHGISIKGVQGNNLRCRLFNGLTFDTELRNVHWILCDAQDKKNRAAFEEMMLEPLVGDKVRVVSRNGVAIDDYDGFVNGAAANGGQLIVQIGGAPVNIDMPRIRSISLAQNPNQKIPAPVCWLKDSSENLFALASAQSVPEGYKVKTVSGIELVVPRNFVTHFDFTPGKIAYLSDLRALAPRVEPVLSGIQYFKRDRNLEGGPISIGRKIYAKGLATHSRTVLEYEVKGYNWFRCVLGIDDIVTGPAHVIVTIDGDNKQIFKSEVTNRDKPKEIKLDIKGIERLRITVDYGKDLDLGDHVDFGDARITK